MKSADLKSAVDASVAHFLPLSEVALQPVRGPSVEPGIYFLDGVQQAVGLLSIKPLTHVPVPQWMTRVWSSFPSQFKSGRRSLVPRRLEGGDGSCPGDAINFFTRRPAVHGIYFPPHMNLNMPFCMRKSSLGIAEQ